MGEHAILTLEEEELRSYLAHFDGRDAIPREIEALAKEAEKYEERKERRRKVEHKKALQDTPLISIKLSTNDSAVKERSTKA